MTATLLILLLIDLAYVLLFVVIHVKEKKNVDFPLWFCLIMFYVILAAMIVEPILG